MIERQCEGWPPFYFVQGPFGLKIWSETEPIKGATISFTIGGWEDRAPITIWMDGRPHPSKYAEHTARRLHHRHLGRHDAGGLHHAHEGRLHPEERSAEQRPGDDDVALLPSRRHLDDTGGRRRPGLPRRAADRLEKLSAVRGADLADRSTVRVRIRRPESAGRRPALRAGKESRSSTSSRSCFTSPGKPCWGNRKRCIPSTARKSRAPTFAPSPARATAGPCPFASVSRR